LAAGIDILSIVHESKNRRNSFFVDSDLNLEEGRMTGLLFDRKDMNGFVDKRNPIFDLQAHVLYGLRCKD
jgi:hypothetical protein